MKIGSLFDGSGGFPLAGSLCGIEPVWASEVEPYPIAVTKNRFPQMKHLGDISKINGAEVEPVDVVTFGSPCQDLSVAGKRAGLKHEANGDEETTRSGLFMEAVRIIKEMRRATNGKYPTFALWENVPGAFSSNKGEDFRIVLEELIKIVEPTAVMPEVPKSGWPYADCYVGYGWSLAYRVFDAQYWGVPQRRRRIHLVLDLRGERAREVLFEREGVRGYFASGRTPREAVASYAERGFGADDRAKCYGISSYDSNAMKSSNPYSGIYEANTSRTLDLNGGNPACNQGGVMVVEPVPNLLLDDQGGQQISIRTDEKCPTLRAEAHGNVPCVVEAGGFCPEQSAKTRGIGWEKETSPTLRAGVTPGVCITLEPGIAAREGGHIYEGVAGTLRANAGDNQMAVAYSIENHPADSRVNIDDSGKVQTLTSRMGTGGGNVPMVMEQVYCLQGNGIDRADTAGCNGRGWNDETCYTLNTIDRPAVAYCTDVGFFNSQEDVAPTLLARSYKDPHLVSYPKGVRYIVRRLTPTECARLQGFADGWGYLDKKEDFTDEEYQFWLNVRNTHAEINGKQVKEYTKEQMLTWYSKLHTDSAEYKMWGNGIALPPALYCMEGISEVLCRE